MPAFVSAHSVRQEKVVSTLRVKVRIGDADRRLEKLHTEHSQIEAQMVPLIYSLIVKFQ